MRTDTSKKVGKKHPDDFYEHRPRMSEEEKNALMAEIEQCKENLRVLKKKMRLAKPRRVLKTEKLQEIRRKNAERLAPYRFKKQETSVTKKKKLRKNEELNEEQVAYYDNSE